MDGLYILAYEEKQISEYTDIDTENAQYPRIKKILYYMLISHP